MKAIFQKWFGVHTQEVLYGTFVAAFFKVTGAGLMFGYNILLARMLGVEYVGLYYLAIMGSTVATIFGRMGLDNSMLRFTASSMATDNWSALKGVYNKGLQLAVCASTFSSVVLFTTAPWLADHIFNKPNLGSPLRIASVSVVPMVTLLIHSEMLKGLKRIKDSQLIQGIFVPVLSSIGLLFFVKFWGLNGAVLAYVSASVIASLIVVRLWRQATPQLKKYDPDFQLSDLLRSALPLFWVSSVQLIVSYTSTFFLGIFSTLDSIGIFEIASKTSMLISFILVSVNTIAAPKFAELYSEGNLFSLGKTVQDCVKIMAFIAGPIFLLFIMSPVWVLGFFGPKFQDGSNLLIILSVGQFINVISGSVGYLLIMSGNEKILRNITAIVALESIILNIILIRFFGVLGAAISTALSVISFNALAFLCVRIKLKIWTLPFLPLPAPISV